jgi:hypothetical protein
MLVLLQDVYVFRVPAVPIIRSTILQLAVTGITWSHHCIELQLSHSDVTTVYSGQPLKWTLSYTSRSNAYTLYQ